MYAKLPTGIFADELGAYSQPAKLLHLAALCRCAALLTDGQLRTDQLVMAAASVGVLPYDAAVAELVGGALWQDLGAGTYHLPTYLRDNPSREESMRLGYVKQEAGRLGGIKSAQVRRSKAEARAIAAASPHALANGQADGQHMPQQTVKQNSSSISISTSLSDSASASARAREEGNLPVAAQLHPEMWPGQRAAFAEFGAAYPKIVPDELWPVFRDSVPDPATWAEAARGLNEYNESDQWLEDPQRFATAPGKWLRQRFWTKPAPGAGRHGSVNNGGTNRKARSSDNDAIAGEWQPGAAFVADLDHPEDRP